MLIAVSYASGFLPSEIWLREEFALGTVCWGPRVNLSHLNESSGTVLPYGGVGLEVVQRAERKWSGMTAKGKSIQSTNH